MNPTQSTNPNPNSETELNLTTATKLLSARDFIGAKRLAELVLDYSTVSSDDRADQILAISDVLIADQNRYTTSGNVPDYYAVLQIPRNGFEESLLKRNYRRLSLLLHPDRNRFPGSDDAFRVLTDAYSVMSDPVRRSEVDSIFAGFSGQEGTFWTVCKFCLHAHLYSRAYLNQMLKCQNCKKAFEATEVGTPPTVVPGTDKYHAIWGFFPIGFANPGSADWNPFVPVQPNGNVNGDRKQSVDDRRQNEHLPSGQSVGGRGRRKTAARKTVISQLKTHSLRRDAENGSCSSTGNEEETREED